MNYIHQIVKDIDKFTDRDRASMDLFEMAIEREWGARLLLAKEIYHTEQVYFDREVEAELHLLDSLLYHYLAIEEFERCSKIKSLSERLRSENGVDTFITDFIKRNDIIF